MVVIRKPKKNFFLFLIGLKKCWCLNSLKHEIEFIIKSNESLAQNKKNKLMNMEDDKTNEPHKFIFNLSQRLNLTLIWVGLLGVCFEVGGGGYSLSKTR